MKYKISVLNQGVKFQLDGTFHIIVCVFGEYTDLQSSGTDCVYLIKCIFFPGFYLYAGSEVFVRFSKDS